MHPKEIVKVLQNKNAAELFEAVCDTYRDVRVLGYTSEDQDMLLFQYGVYDWGQGEKFELDLTRQLMNSDGEIYHLRSTLYYEPTCQLRSVPEKNEWCGSPSKLEEFVNSIQTSNGYIACRSITPVNVVVEYGCV